MPSRQQLSLVPQGCSSNEEIGLESVKWLFVAMKNKKPFLYMVQFPKTATGSERITLLKTEYNAVKLQTPWHHPDPELRDAIVSKFTIGDLEAQQYPRQTIVVKTAPLPELQVAFQTPAMINESPEDFDRRYKRFNITPVAGRQHRHSYHAVLITTRPRKDVMLVALAASAIVALGLGIGAGFLFHSAELGFVACFGAVAILTMVEMYLLK